MDSFPSVAELNFRTIATFQVLREREEDVSASYKKLVPQYGIEPHFDAYKATVIPIYYKGKIGLHTRI